MKLWHIAALLLVLGIGFVLISRPTLPKQSGNQASTSNSLWSGVIGGGIQALSGFLGKATAPSSLSASASDPIWTGAGPSPAASASPADQQAALAAYDSGPGYSYGP